MNQQITIGIVEDELLIAEKIKHLLMEIGYSVCEPVSTYDEALEMIKTKKPDLLLLDINLNSDNDGIDIAEKVNELYQLPFIFLTANSDSGTIERAKAVKPYAYLVKPYTKDELFAAIEIAFNNYRTSKNSLEKPPEVAQNRSFTFVREQHRFIKIVFDSIVYIESLENYVVVHTKDQKKSTIRSTLNEFLQQLPADKFYRTHRSYAVHADLIENIEPTEVVVFGHKVPMSNTYRAGLFALLGIK